MRWYTNKRELCNSLYTFLRFKLLFDSQVVQSCISCLGAVVNKVTHNIRLVKDYFQKYYGKIGPLVFSFITPSTLFYV